MDPMTTKMLLLALPLVLAACGPGTARQAGDSKTAADEENGEAPAKSEDMPQSAAPTTDKPAPGSADDSAGPKKDECSAFEISNLEEVLLKSACEVPNPKPEDKLMDAKNVEVKVVTNGVKVTPGGHMDVTVIFTNKTKDVLPLLFTIDPMPRFEVQAYDTKGNRIDMPKNNPPALPAGVAPRVPGEPHTARVVLAANGSAKMSLGWDANKTKWAPEKLKGTPPEKGYPRAPAGPLGKGKYQLRVVTPLIGVFEGIDHEVTQPRTPIEVGK
jgi:hypothetical protein